MSADERYMSRCLFLAAKGLGKVAPNPMVGAVLVHDGRIISEGYHRKFGGAHAEVDCLDAVADADRHLIPSSTLYVSLEPCAHHGKTPPCTDRIIRERIPEVVVSCRDPFPQVDGKGLEQLRDAGVIVRFGALESQAEWLNRRFFTFHRKKRPYVILKWAQTADGMIAGPGKERTSISNPMSSLKVHWWREAEQAIMVGTDTVGQDDPMLTVRSGRSGVDPVRVVIDRYLRLPLTRRIFHPGASVVVFNTLREDHAGHLLYCRVDDERDLLPAILDRMYGLNLQSVLVEGGTVLLESFLRLDAWDEIRRITATDKRIPGGYPGPLLPEGLKGDATMIGKDKIEIFTHE